MGMNRQLKRMRAKQQKKTIKNKKLTAEGFNPDLDFSGFFSNVNAKLSTIDSLVEEFYKNPSRDTELIRWLNLEDKMFNEETIELVKNYASITNEIGAVLPDYIEYKMDKKDLEYFYENHLKIYSYIFIFYKVMAIDRIEATLLKKAEKYIQAKKALFPEKYWKKITIISDYIEENLYPHFVIPNATEEGNKLFMNCRNGKINSKSFLLLGIENTKQKELSDDYIIEKAMEIVNINF